MTDISRSDFIKKIVNFLQKNIVFTKKCLHFSQNSCTIDLTKTKTTIWFIVYVSEGGVYAKKVPYFISKISDE